MKLSLDGTDLEAGAALLLFQFGSVNRFVLGTNRQIPCILLGRLIQRGVSRPGQSDRLWELSAAGTRNPIRDILGAALPPHAAQRLLSGSLARNMLTAPGVLVCPSYTFFRRGPAQGPQNFSEHNYFRLIWGWDSERLCTGFVRSMSLLIGGGWRVLPRLGWRILKIRPLLPSCNL